MPLRRKIDLDDRFGRLPFLEAALLKRFGPMARAHFRLAADVRHRAEARLQARILWGMLTGAYSCREQLRMAMSPRLATRTLLALGGSLAEGGTRRAR